MFEKIKDRLSKIITTASLFATIYGTKVLAATTPDEDELNEIASKGLKIFFGALAQNKVQNKIIAGVMCLIAAAIIFIVLRWTQGLFDLA